MAHEKYQRHSRTRGFLDLHGWHVQHVRARDTSAWGVLQLLTKHAASNLWQLHSLGCTADRQWQRLDGC